jgi:hypothetical protein
MSNFIGFAGVGSAIIASMGLAMWLEWFCLSWLMRVMPGRARNPLPNLSATGAGEETERDTAEPKLPELEKAMAAPPKSTRHEIRPGI